MNVIELREDIEPTVIGSRWQPAHVIRMDTTRGFYEEVNAPIREEALHVQRCLIDKPAPRRVPWQLWWLALAVGAVTLAVALK